ncbi:Zn-dependent protease with chaperone function [Pleurocapsa sp. CCALA 161]|uniref:M56 family metallopeptidase n=1 Tax=Pleurocapsa sp. CCALA 161 TaxID=2107688 RepID=UPI000D052444|nr:M56 family metallopeptidase [Pleurocapsa sp. CCALA 161]PSB11451.1 Zn-dependent protease with chaperone function [Pleurocapsa sp. CCALA 161]
MHLLAISTVVILATIIRYQSTPSSGEWSQRWYKTLFLFCFPGLLLLTTAITVLYMGCHGEMLGVKAGSVGCFISAGLILFASGCLVKLAIQGDRSIRQVRNYPTQVIGQTAARILEFDLPYSAQIGFWKSQLVISRGLLTTLDSEHITAVIAHEQAHVEYRDTFWFFWLGWIRSFSFWLPNTELLWQELLLLRELRADRKAAESVDFLLLAESLLAVAKAPLESPLCCVSLNDAQIGDRLSERISSLLNQTESVPDNRWYNWSWLCLLLMPLLTIPLHY